MKPTKVGWSELDGIGIIMEVTRESTTDETKECVKCAINQIVSHTGCLNVGTLDVREYE